MRKPRASLTGYAIEVAVVRVGSAPLASIGPLAEYEIRHATTASTPYPLDPQLPSTYGFLP
ncbi:MAG TPA: hypothetical protein VFL61_01715 [Gaiellaceae bacterium]|nr:hypothetical protein [Gaiellaceae bacterium]